MEQAILVRGIKICKNYAFLSVFCSGQVPHGAEAQAEQEPQGRGGQGQPQVHEERLQAHRQAVR